MCANYVPVTQSDRLLSFFGVVRDRDELPVDMWPTGIAPIIRLHEDGSGNRIVDDAAFGLLPHFAVEMAEGRRTYNARTETVHKLPSFREAWSKGWRCIVPVERIYEPNYESGKAVRWAIRQEGGFPMGLAGIYRKWRSDDGREVLTFSMLTVNADEHPLMKRFHKPGDEKRMVVVLDPADYGAWLSCSVEEAPMFFKQWMGALDAFDAALPPRVQRPASTPAPDTDPGVDSGQLF